MIQGHPRPLNPIAYIFSAILPSSLIHFGNSLGRPWLSPIPILIQRMIISLAIIFGIKHSPRVVAPEASGLKVKTCIMRNTVGNQYLQADTVVKRSKQ